MTSPRPSNLREGVAAVAVGLSIIGQAISMAVLVFSGPLNDGLPRAITSFVIAGGVVSAYIGVRSRIVPAGSVIQDGPAIVTVAVAAAVAARGEPPRVSDVFVLLVLATSMTGALMWLLGRFHLGGLVRYIPTTVVGAFMAGTGWLLAKGGLDVAVGFTVELEAIGHLFSAEVVKYWVPALGLGTLVWSIGRSDRVPAIVMSGTIVASLAVFYGVVALVSSISAVENDGWLIGPFPDATGPRLVSVSEVADADWANVVSQFPGIASIVAVSVMVVLLNVTALGMQSATRPDVDFELRAAGVANVVCAPLGVVPGFHGLADTTLIRQLGGSSRLVPVVAGGALVGFGFFGIGLIGYVPRLVIGAMLFTVGLALLADWVMALARSVSTVERSLSIGIVLVIAAVGILEGIAAGLVAVCVVFIVRYSRVDPIRIAGTGHDMRSRVDRTPVEVAALGERADRLAVFELQGYLFFGSVTSIDDLVRAVTTSPDEETLDAVVLDFRMVSGLDTSGYELIGSVAQHVSASGTLVLFSSIDDGLRRSLLESESEAFRDVAWAATLDEALEVSERLQLQRAADVDATITEQRIELSSALLAEFDERAFDAGAVLMRQGEPSDGLFVVVEGSMTAVRVDEAGDRHRLRRFGRAAMVGEIGLVTGGPRTAEIIVETDAVVLWLSTARYLELRRMRPELAFELNDYIMRSQAARVVSLSEGLTRSSR